MPSRPRLTPAIADVRRAVRESLTAALPAGAGDEPGALVLVGLSGGPDSLALAAATAFEAPRMGLRAGAVIVDHGLQPDSASVAARAAQQARELGLDPVVVTRVAVGSDGGLESAARDARRDAFDRAVEQTGAARVLLGHTLDDQAETVLLGLARGSGPDSLSGMRGDTGRYLRPLLAIPRRTTVDFCADSGVKPWTDPHNSDDRFARVRVRTSALPALEASIGPGVAAALARTADQLREDAEALEFLAQEWLEEIAEHAEAGIALPIAALVSQPAAIRQRVIRLAVDHEFGVSLSRAHTLAAARLATDWHGQGPVDLPGVTVLRRDGLLCFEATPATASSD